jgi:hypothetical protein
MALYKGNLASGSKTWRGTSNLHTHTRGTSHVGLYTLRGQYSSASYSAYEFFNDYPEIMIEC